MTLVVHIAIVSSVILLWIKLCGGQISPQYVVPDIVHQTYDYQNPNFFLFLSILTVQRFMKPSKHILWVNDEGRYRKMHWDGWQKRAQPGSWEFEFAQYIRNNTIEAKLLTFPASPPGNASTFAPNKAHRSDFVRMQALLEQGGMYLDTDVFALKPLTELRIHEFTLSFDNIVNPDRAASKRLNNGVLLSAPNASFLRLWMKEYAHFNPQSFDYDSSVVPFKLAADYPDLVNIEWNRIAPVSYGFQTARFADTLSCGLYHPTSLSIHTPAYDHAARRYTLASTKPSVAVVKRLQNKLLLHLTMSQVRGTSMLRRQLNSPDELAKMPSYLGHIFRLAYYGQDDFDYEALHAASEAERLAAYTKCREFLGMHTPPDQLQDHEQHLPWFRQQYVSD
ncbi:hypothetical protein EON65_05100 [archaeon]|nr:MAG: hypothetical protein EON65_05100 [archaeon]